MTLTYESSPNEVADELIAECKRRGYSREACIAVDSTGRQESGLRMVWSPKRQWFGYFQQDESYPNRMDPRGNMLGFLDRLDKQLQKPGASPDIWKNIFWLQQGPNHPSADHAYEVGRKAYLTEIQRHIDAATMDYDRSVDAPVSGGSQVGWRGDPVWLPDVLRAEGLRCDVLEGAFNRGHGDMGDIWGVMMHHTGSNGATPESIAFHPELGLASQLWLGRDGRYVLCGVGIAWHAGSGSWAGLGTNNANPRMIGIEAACDGGGSPPGRRDAWPDVQYDAYIRGVAAIQRKLGYDSSHVLGHKDWAGKAQGKWDPGGLDMPTVRADIQRRIFPPQPPKQDQEGIELVNVSREEFDALAENVLEVRRQLRGVDDKGWAQLGQNEQGENRSLVDGVAALLAAKDA